MEIKRCYPVLVGASVVENQLCNGESVTVPNGHKFYLKTSGTESLGASTGTAITGLTSGTDMVIDLSQFLGSAIADYVYSLEQATAGSGIAWLRSYGFLTDGYVPVNAGRIESVEATAKMVRDANGENAVTYPLGNDVLRGLFKLDASNKLYADGDRKEADGTITRRYGNGTPFYGLNWNYSSSYGYWVLDSASSSVVASVIKTPTSNANTVNMITNGYTVVTRNEMYRNPNAPDKSISVATNGSIIVKDTSVTNTSYNGIKSIMDVLTVVYELATPTAEQSTPFTSPQIVYPDGTEEFVTENGVPVGHETKYQL